MYGQAIQKVSDTYWSTELCPDSYTPNLYRTLQTQNRNTKSFWDWFNKEKPEMIKLVSSIHIFNFFIAVKADIFVGVRGSTYSTDAFSCRYYQHKEDDDMVDSRTSGGGENYIVGPEGIKRLYGPPKSHSKCK